MKNLLNKGIGELMNITGVDINSPQEKKVRKEAYKTKREEDEKLKAKRSLHQRG